jgi:hypothetical protein
VSGNCPGKERKSNVLINLGFQSLKRKQKEKLIWKEKKGNERVCRERYGRGRERERKREKENERQIKEKQTKERNRKRCRYTTKESDKRER